MANKRATSSKIEVTQGAAATASTAKNKSASKKASSKPATKSPRSKAAVSKASGSKKPRSTGAFEQVERMLRRKAGVTSFDTFGCAGESEEDHFVVAEPGESFGRCGGRTMTSKMEKRVCDMLSSAGVAHCHRPRRYEVKVDDKMIAAYSPCIALRGRGREGKTSVLEVLAELDAAHVSKLQAFRKLYESEFYVTLVAPGHVHDEVASDCRDEAVLPSELASLVARLAD